MQGVVQLGYWLALTRVIASGVAQRGRKYTRLTLGESLQVEQLDVLQVPFLLGEIRLRRRASNLAA